MRRLCAALAIALLGGYASAAEMSAAYNQVLTTPDGAVTRSTVLVSGTQFRMETELQGVKTVMVRNAGGVFSYMPESGVAMKLAGVDLSQEPVTGEYLAYLDGRHATKLREETVEGRVCDVYQFADEKGHASRAWVWREKQFPVRMEMDGPDGTITATLSNIRMNVPAPASAFQLPAGAQLMDMGAMMDMKKLLGQ